MPEKTPPNGLPYAEALTQAALKRLGREVSPPRKENIDQHDIEDIVRKVRVRLAGWRDGERIDPQEDVERFQRLERPAVRWREEFDRASLQIELSTDEYELNPAHWAAIKKFKEKGGHVTKLAPEKILYLMKYGVIAFLELEVRENLFVTLGSVSALSASPYSPHDPLLPPPRDDRNLHQLWPNYDLRDIGGLPPPTMEAWAEERDRRLFIVRSTILERLREEDVCEDLKGTALPEHLKDRDLRRIGLAARGKFEIFSIAEHEGSESVSFNIGTISHPKDRRLRLDLGNKPSQEHNKWADPVSWRRAYYDVLIHSPDYHKVVAMYWRAYDGDIEDGLEMIRATGGIFDRKGYDHLIAEESAWKNTALIRRDIEEGHHAPWLLRDMPTKL